MESQSQTFMDSEACINQMNASVQDGDPGVASSTPDRSEPQLPVKRPTRQWAAWTRQEEESFFTALRQVGKNFEKITRRVQSKNKDQVRHYYYRLVRRMNKLLGPGLCLDAKNSKDTNAAMLRWWSLLEKYSCKASKLHLKPRRFKIFIEALENQLMKDRKKNVRKRPSLGESSSPIAPSSVTNHNKASATDVRTVKLVLVDSQNMQKLGTGRGSTKRNVNIGVIRSNKGDSTLIKPTRQRRKQGVASSAAYKRWEKAAIAGVSLVADAAEHLERTATDREGEQDHDVPGFKFTDQVQRVMLPLPASLERNYNDSSAQTNLKLKLQLFPIDDATRRALEMDKHNPHLELTLSSRKKISSVMEHLNKKWGNSSVSAGELMLFPYSAHRENLVGYQGWTQESMASAADVHSAIGSPPVFRLRYGWFSSNEFMPIKWQDNLGSNQTSGRETTDFRIGKEMVVDLASTCGISTGDPSPNHMSPSRNRVTAVNKDDIPANPALEISSDINVPGARNDFIETSANVQWHNKSNTDVCNKKQLDEADGLRSSNGAAISAGEWADSLTNISVGDLLSEVPSVVNNDCIEPPPAQNDLYLQQTPFSCDSFDAAIAAHLSKHQKMVLPSAEAPHIYSIWDAEETCDAFSFQKICASCPEVPSLSTAASPVAGKQMPETSSMVTDAFLEESPDMDPVDCPTDGDPVDECPPDSPSIDAVTKDFSGLTDIYWPDSLGPLDLDIPSSKYHGNDLILSDSLSGLNRLIASSLDAFQNCSFFGVEKKDSSSAVEARESISFSDFKIGSGV